MSIRDYIDHVPGEGLVGGHPWDSRGANEAALTHPGNRLADALEGIVATLFEEIDGDTRGVGPAEAASPASKPNLGSAWVAIECDETGDILLGKRAKTSNNPGQWNLFGGGIDVGESAEQAAVRELREEAGLRVDPARLKRISTTGKMMIFSLSANRRTVTRALRLNRKETEKAKWFPTTNLPTNLHKSTITLIQSLHADDDIVTGMLDPRHNTVSRVTLRGMMESDAHRRSRR